MEGEVASARKHSYAVLVSHPKKRSSEEQPKTLARKLQCRFAWNRESLMGDRNSSRGYVKSVDDKRNVFTNYGMEAIASGYLAFFAGKQGKIIVFPKDWSNVVEIGTPRQARMNHERQASRG